MKRLFALAFAFTAACTSTPGDGPSSPTDGKADADSPSQPVEDYCNATDPRQVPVEVVATPEAGEAPYLAALEAAAESIAVEIYLMGSGGIMDALQAKARDGVAVRVILDQHKRDTNQRYHDLLVAAGAQVKWSSPEFSHFHSKLIIVDGETAVISTGNYSKSYMLKERNFVATDRDPADLADLVALFEADWNGTSLEMPCTRMVVSPINARERILEVIESAEDTLEIESMQFGDTEVREAVKQRVLDGVNVRVMLADAGWIDANASAATFLKDLGVEVKWMPHVHSKAIIADANDPLRAAAYVGSVNLSWTSLEKNREVGLVVVEETSIAPLSTTFEKDWLVGTSF